MKLKNVLIIAIAILSLGLIVACSDDVVATKDNNLNAYRVTESNGAFVYNETKYETLQDALDAIANGKTSGPEKIITLTRDVVGPVAKVAAGQSVGLDLGGYTLTFYGVKDNALTIGSGSNFQIKNGTMALQDTSNEDLVVVYADGTNNLTFDGVTINAEGQMAIDANGTAHVAVTNGSAINGNVGLAGTSSAKTKFTADKGTNVTGVVSAKGAESHGTAPLDGWDVCLEINNNIEAIDMKWAGIHVLSEGHATMLNKDTSETDNKYLATNGSSAITVPEGSAAVIVSGLCMVDTGLTVTYYGSIKEALLDSNNVGQTIKLLDNDNQDLDATLSIPYNVTIDLNGNVLHHGVSASSNPVMTLTDGVVLTVTNSKDEIATIGHSIVSGEGTSSLVSYSGTSGKLVFAGAINISGTLTDGTYLTATVYGSKFENSVTAEGAITLNGSTTKENVVSHTSVHALNNANLGAGEFDDDIHAPIITIVNSTVGLDKLIKGVVVENNVNTDVPADLIHLANVTGTINEAIVAADSDVSYTDNTVNSTAYAFYLKNAFTAGDQNFTIKKITATGIANSVQAVYISNASTVDRYIIIGDGVNESINATTGNVYVEINPVSGTGSSIVNIQGSVTTNTSGNIELNGKSNNPDKRITVSGDISSAGELRTRYCLINGSVVTATTITDGNYDETKTTVAEKYTAGSTFAKSVNVTGAARFYNSIFSPAEGSTTNPQVQASTVEIGGATFVNLYDYVFNIKATKTVENPEASSEADNLKIIASTGKAGSISTNGSKKVDTNTYKSNIVIDNTDATAALEVGSVSAQGTDAHGDITITGNSSEIVTAAAIHHADAVETQFVEVNAGLIYGDNTVYSVATLTDGKNEGSSYSNGSTFEGGISTTGDIVLYNSTTKADVTSGTSVSAYKATLGNGLDEDISAPVVSITDGSKMKLNRIGGYGTSSANSVTIDNPAWWDTSNVPYTASTIGTIDTEVLSVTLPYTLPTNNNGYDDGYENGKLVITSVTATEKATIKGGTYGDSSINLYKDVAIYGGVFNGTVNLSETTTSSITGGFFNVTANLDGTGTIEGTCTYDAMYVDENNAVSTNLKLKDPKFLSNNWNIRSAYIEATAVSYVNNIIPRIAQNSTSKWIYLKCSDGFNIDGSMNVAPASGVTKMVVDFNGAEAASVTARISIDPNIKVVGSVIVTPSYPNVYVSGKPLNDKNGSSVVYSLEDSTYRRVEWTLFGSEYQYNYHNYVLHLGAEKTLVSKSNIYQHDGETTKTRGAETGYGHSDNYLYYFCNPDEFASKQVFVVGADNSSDNIVLTRTTGTIGTDGSIYSKMESFGNSTLYTVVGASNILWSTTPSSSTYWSYAQDGGWSYARSAGPSGSTGHVVTYEAAPYDNAITVYFHSNYGTDVIKTQEMKYGVSTILSSPFSRSGYTFIGWSLASESDVFYSTGASVSLKGDLHLYAKWQ